MLVAVDSLKTSFDIIPIENFGIKLVCKSREFALSDSKYHN